MTTCHQCELADSLNEEACIQNFYNVAEGEYIREHAREHHRMCHGKCDCRHIVGDMRTNNALS